MATADSPKTLQPSCSARVFCTHMNQQPGNTLITSRCARGSSLGSDVARGKTQRWLCYLQQMAKTSQNWTPNPARTPNTPQAGLMLTITMTIANYKNLDIIAWVLQEENRQKAMALGQGSSLNKFSTTKNLGQKCAKCGKTNHTMQNHWPGGKNLNKKGKGHFKSKKPSDSSGKKKMDKKGKGK